MKSLILILITFTQTSWATVGESSVLSCESTSVDRGYTMWIFQSPQQPASGELYAVGLYGLRFLGKEPLNVEAKNINGVCSFTVTQNSDTDGNDLRLTVSAPFGGYQHQHAGTLEMKMDGRRISPDDRRVSCVIDPGYFRRMCAEQIIEYESPNELGLQ